MFEIQNFPGDLFSHITKTGDYIDNYRLVMFKEDLDKLHGFIAYEGEFTYIALNHKRPICLQNFTLAHELGHYFLHRGKCFSDSEIESIQQKDEEAEAFQFGQELLYPDELFNEDYSYIMKNSLLSPNNAKSLGLFINDLCHKYYMSFPVILMRHLYKAFKARDYRHYNKEINTALGMKYTELDHNFYIAQGSTFDCPSNMPYEYLRMEVEKAIEKRVVSEATGEAILFPYKDREGD